ncbi:MAG TPA: ATP-dependent helicase [Jatrophihabitans sp.]|jgi:DNA helicase-2/ATP-dependent DNA helicase PcrA|uniref:ATP-dependent helicase n=1 Tax=Jatrophihabitans sp. TaxID=1932789 RepID=UPI002E065E06|nr:ATP-dependent helicase [Jatrophihabitans sp.]
MVDTQWADGLDDAQLDAVTHGRGPLVVMAGAGTGKTRMLTSRVARLLESGVRPERVLLLTFTRRAAASMTSRAAALCGDPRVGQRVWGGTFHAVAHRLVTEYAGALGLTGVTLLDPEDVVGLMDLLREEHGLTGTGTRFPSSQKLADLFSRTVNTGRPARTILAEELPDFSHQTDEVLGLFRAFMARKREQGLLDFDDLLLCWVQLLADPVLGEKLRRRWDWVLVDEYQDVNRAQVDIVTGLRPDGDGLTVVGDDAQAIYGFRGASGAHLSDLLHRLPDATLVRLQRNFRSVQPVLDLANVVRPGAGGTRLRLTADRAGASSRRPVLVRCDDADTESRMVADAVLDAQQNGLALREQAVLMRAGSHSNALEVELAIRNIPYVKYGGIRFLDTAHVRDLVAALRVTTNPRDELAWYRLLGRHRNIGRATARALTPLLVADDPDTNAVVAAAPDKARTALAATLTQLATARSSTDAGERATACFAAVRPLIRAHYPDWTARLEDVEHIADAAATRNDLAGFVAELTLDPGSSSADYAGAPHKDEDYLTLSTVHSAKGLEWTDVHVIHAVDGAFPSDMALHDDDGLEEEQRLFYVAITRARDSLTVYTPTRMPTDWNSYRARQVHAKASRFLTEDALRCLEVRVPTRPAATVEPVTPHARVAIPTLDHLFG